MKKKTLFFLSMLLCTAAYAQNDSLKLHFDFTSVEGTTVKDNVTGLAAKTVGSASVKSIGKYKVLDLGDANGYLDMTQEAGKVAKTLGDFTVSVYYRVNVDASLSGAGHFLWCFSQSAANTQTASPYMAYRLNAQRMATSTGGWGSESGLEVGSESEKGRWIHMLYRQAGKRGELFIDGKRVKTSTTMPIPKETFTATPAYCWIGRPPFSGDSYLKQTL
ncbi:MAG: laminin G, partial [Bacteroidaceae bacterium]|nr:laminin G [Bacteroidaceae bacterium]